MKSRKELLMESYDEVAHALKDAIRAQTVWKQTLKDLDDAMTEFEKATE